MAEDTYALFSYTFQDELGTKASAYVPVYFDGTLVTPTILKTQWTTMGTNLDGMTSAQIISGSINIVPAVSGSWKDTPDAGSRVEQTANFNFANAVTKYKYGVNIPSLANAAIDGGQIDLANTDVAAFIAQVIAGFTNGNFVNTGIHILTALADAFISFRKHRRQVDRATYEVP